MLVHQVLTPEGDQKILYHFFDREPILFDEHTQKAICLHENLNKLSKKQIFTFIENSLLPLHSIVQINEDYEALMFLLKQQFALILREKNTQNYLPLVSGNCSRTLSQKIALNNFNINPTECLIFPDDVELIYKAKFYEENFFCKFLFWNEKIITEYEKFLIFIFTIIPEYMLSKIDPSLEFFFIFTLCYYVPITIPFYILSYVPFFIQVMPVLIPIWFASFDETTRHITTKLILSDIIVNLFVPLYVYPSSHYEIEKEKKMFLVKINYLRQNIGGAFCDIIRYYAFSFSIMTLILIFFHAIFPFF
jgi:hypothetical protein